MRVLDQELLQSKPTHTWLQRIHVAFVPGTLTPLLEQARDELLRHFVWLGHQLQSKPDDNTDVILTTARLGEIVSWRKSLMLVARRRYHLQRTPQVFTLVHATRTQVDALLKQLATALAQDPPDLQDFKFPGLGPAAPHVLTEQGQRGGPIMAFERLVQAQIKGIRIILLIGEDSEGMALKEAYHFDLAGAHPCTTADDLDTFYTEIALRIATAASTQEVTQHRTLNGIIPASVWANLRTPQDLCLAGHELGRRHFFTDMIRVADLVYVPAVSDALASQYSEGCFGTWEPAINALIATATGSARPVYKGNITLDELAVIAGTRPDGQGALVHRVEGRPDVLPSSEAVEMISLDETLNRITLEPEWGHTATVPIARSKLHGHRGIAAYDPAYVEYTPLDAPYYHYLVSCATEAQARGIRAAFSRAQSLRNQADSRQVVFTVLPGHGVVIVEKWVLGKRPLQTIWEYMDAGYLQVQNRIPQGTMRYVQASDGRMYLQEP